MFLDNGGDGYTAARHLALLGYNPAVMYTKKPEKEHFRGLIAACEAHDIKVLDYSQDTELSENFEAKVNTYDLVLDALFGFSFKGPIREPYDKIIKTLKVTKPPIFSIDIPSGWDVEAGFCATISLLNRLIRQHERSF